MPEPFLSIVIPAHNEQRRLPQTLEQVVAFVNRQTFSTEVLVVENASRDDTLKIAQDFAGRYPLIRAIHEDLPGKGRAVQKGMLAATGRYRFFADADFSMPVEEISR